ncbi:PP2C family protein-serine/threonine phosphatase [Streptomyces barringtoniae]|uniref:PP2C family protein-serine/threonine phosphatase n=1 Tax=Streptomyces barringtoniae TaxID=2892029 RepID=UPI001E562C0B|nr:GAF domain-containing SpoIIE family protein phosphatase [Streptomyces barringtoniae]MCC5480087.1 SpoIIE family protein phosphatase [Streptomyces barringtoniae]
MDASNELLRRAEPSALLYPDGAVRSLNEAMASALSRPAEQCVGRCIWELLPTSQRSVAKRIVANANKQQLTMRVLELPRPGRVCLVTLVEARPTTAAGGKQLVWVHALNVHNDLGSLLIPFRESAKAAGLGLCVYLPQVEQLEWLGGAPAVGALFPEASMPLPWMVRHVHPDDRGILRQLLDSGTTGRPWTGLRFQTERGDWHQLACQTRRIQLGYDGPEQVFGTIRDDTRQEARRKRMLAALGVERRRADEFAEFSFALIRTATEQELRQVVLTRLAATFGGSGAALMLVEDGRLFASSDGGLTWRAEVPPRISLDVQSPMAQATRTGKPLFIANQEEFLRRWPHADASPLQWPGPDAAVSITPLGPPGDRPLGAWMVAYDSGHRPSPDESAFMLTLAELAGQALARIRSQQARVELATAVQRHMLPTLPEHLPGLEVAARYRPRGAGLDIGGDWYDAFPVPNGAVALEIGDAQGHDVDAAAFMGQVRGAMRAIAAHEPNPGAVLTHVNQLLVAMDAPRFASCTMLHIDPRDGQVTGVSAGHVPLLCAHEDGSHDIRRLPGGPVLGVLPDVDYPQETFTLDRDTALVMVTDGVVEAPDLSLDAGLEHTGAVAAQALHDGLSPEETADRILDDAIAMNHPDDLAVLVVRRT